MSPKKVSCVFVFYNPPQAALDTVARLNSYGYQVVVAVNQASPDVIQKLESLKGVHPIINVSNLGLATALNQGICLSFDQLLVDYVVLFDQDSIPDATMPLALVSEYENFPNGEVACIGPMLVDCKDLSATYSQNTLEFLGRMPSTIPTSGTLISSSVWRDVGPMLDDLFIDAVDHEWCFRAQHKGYQIRLSRHLTMIHNMGDASFKLRGKYKPIHKSPVRHYYIIRNALYLISLDYLPIKWRITELAKTIRRALIYPLVSTDFVKSFKLIGFAIFDGIRGRLGPCPIK